MLWHTFVSIRQILFKETAISEKKVVEIRTALDIILLCSLEPTTLHFGPTYFQICKPLLILSVAIFFKKKSNDFKY